MRILLRDLSVGQTYAVQFRSLDGDGNTSDWSQVQRFTTTDDTTPPGNVTGLLLSISGNSFIAKWDKVTTDSTGGPLRDFRWYRVNVSNGATNQDFFTTSEHFEFTRDLNVSTFGILETALAVSVWAVDLTYNESLIAATVTLDATNPPIPSTPVVSNYIGFLLVSWDGLDINGSPMPENFVQCEIHVSTTSGFTPTAATLAGYVVASGSGSNYVVSGLDYGSTYYVRLIAVNSLQKKSNPSAQATGSPERITGLDIQDGQISPAQINFTAKDIGGANAYFKTTAPTTADGNLQIGDIWYDTDNGYTTYRYDGVTPWVAAPEIGVVSGTKILAGTLTADAVGTNLLITATANIADAIIDDAKISDLSVAKLTAGTMGADVIISGRFTTADTGARREMNNVGFQAWDASNNQIINLDGVNNLLTGTLQTALTGRRIVIGAAGRVGEIDFYAPNGTEAWVRAATSLDGNAEYIHIGVPAVSLTTSVVWNSLRMGITSGTNPFADLSSDSVDIYFSGGSTSGEFSIRQATNRGTETTGWASLPRFQIGTSGLAVWDNTGATRLDIDDSSGTFIWGLNSSNQQTLGLRTDNFFWFTWKAIANARIVLLSPDSGRTDMTGKVQLVNSYNFGTQLQYLSTSTGGAARLRILDVNGANPCDVEGGAYTNISTTSSKTDIKKFTADAIGILNKAEVITFRRKPQVDAEGNIGGQREIEHGFRAEQTPPEITSVEEDGTPRGISVTNVVALLVAAVQDFDKRLKSLEGLGKNN